MNGKDWCVVAWTPESGQGCGAGDSGDTSALECTCCVICLCVYWQVTSEQHTPHIKPWNPINITTRRNLLRQFNTTQQRGARPEVTVPTNAGVSWSLLTVAASEGHEHLLSLLLQAGLSIEGGGTTDRTPLMMAAQNGHAHTQCVAALLPVTSSTPAHPEAHTPVHLASYYGHVEVLEQLAGAGWPLTARDSDGNTPMHSAAAGGRVTCVQWLVQRGSDTSMQNNAGHTPLDEQCVAALLPVTSPTPAHPEAHTPVHLASYYGHVEVLEQLAGAGWPLTARDSDGNTPMHSAAAGGRVTCVQWLVQRGGDTSMQNNAGHTPLDEVGSAEGQEGGRMQTVLRSGSKFNR
ncbi:ankyrin repeat domain-containing protein 42-like [Scylla paramamosain]|uniref:ankyrin repeat domain-containing protein 42-like n=1 Tax=Scylla paramamosain TaxID=85552 RepID=UPI003083AA27